MVAATDAAAAVRTISGAKPLTTLPLSGEPAAAVEAAGAPTAPGGTPQLVAGIDATPIAPATITDSALASAPAIARDPADTFKEALTSLTIMAFDEQLKARADISEGAKLEALREARAVAQSKLGPNATVAEIQAAYIAEATRIIDGYLASEASWLQRIADKYVDPADLGTPPALWSVEQLADTDFPQAAAFLQAQLAAVERWAEERIMAAAAKGLCDGRIASLRQALTGKIAEAKKQYSDTVNALSALNSERYAHYLAGELERFERGPNPEVAAALAVLEEERHRDVTHKQVLATALTKATMDLRASSIDKAKFAALLHQAQMEWYSVWMPKARDENITIASFSPTCIAEALAQHAAGG